MFFQEKYSFFLLKQKSETLEKSKNWKIFIENQISVQIKVPRVDNGLEFCNSKFDKFWEQCRILRHKTITYTP